MPFDFRTAFQRALPYGPFLKRYATAENQTRWAGIYNAVSLTDHQRELFASFTRKMYVLCLSGPWCGDCVNACPIYQRIAEASPLIDLLFINRVQNFPTHPPTPVPAAAHAPSIRPGTADDPDDIRSRPIGKILVKWGILTPERVEKALLEQDTRKSQGLNVRIGDVMTDLGLIGATSSCATRRRWPPQRRLREFRRLGHLQWARELSICGGPRVPVLVFLSEDWQECERYGERTLVTYRNKAVKHLARTHGASCPTGLMLPDQEILTANTAEWLTHFERVQWMLLTSPRLMKLHGEM